MPFYKQSEMKKVPVEMGGAEVQAVAGERMKAGFVTYQMGGGPPPHYHPNEEQFILVLEGGANMILGEETRRIGPGDLVHVPRGVRHGIHIAEAPFVFFTAKSPAGSGDLNQDYHPADDAEAVRRRLAGG